MPVTYSNNLFYNATPPATTPLPVWPTIARDTRPACCLVLGDGFTQDLLAATGVDAMIQCRMDSLVPSPTGAQYVPVEGDRFGPGTFWDAEKWPRIWQVQQETGLTGRAFFQHLALSPLNPTRSGGLWSFATGTLEYELRCYLWHLFRYFQSAVKLDGNLVVRWRWRRVLHYLLSEFRLFVVSFNYDLWFEALLHARLCFQDPYYEIPIIPFVERRLLDPYHYRSGTVLIVKPHGSISHHLDLQGIGPLGSNPWLTDNTLSHNFISGTQTRFVKQPGFPMVPDLVPPGRQGDDYCNPASIAPALAHDFLKQAALVIVCGLSGAEPDASEVADLMASVRSGTLCVHIGLRSNDDERSPVGMHARTRAGAAYRFFDAEEVLSIIEYLTGIYEPSWKWQASSSTD